MTKITIATIEYDGDGAPGVSLVLDSLLDALVGRRPAPEADADTAPPPTPPPADPAPLRARTAAPAAPSPVPPLRLVPAPVDGEDEGDDEGDDDEPVTRTAPPEREDYDPATDTDPAPAGPPVGTSQNLRACADPSCGYQHTRPGRRPDRCPACRGIAWTTKRPK